MSTVPAPSATGHTTASADEVARFTAMAEQWWDPAGKFAPLHRFNPIRLEFIRRELAAHFGRDPAQVSPFSGLKLLDVGCGGGLLAEPLARMGFSVTAIDAGERNVAIARAHAAQSGIAIDYRVGGPEDVDAGSFDVVMAMEVIEHVPDPARFLRLTANAARPGGVFLGATLNRTPQSFLMAVVGAEYVLRWLPVGTHDWRRFLRPSEFSALLTQAGIRTTCLRGLSYNPLTTAWRESERLDVNYLVMGIRE